MAATTGTDTDTVTDTDTATGANAPSLADNNTSTTVTATAATTTAALAATSTRSENTTTPAKDADTATATAPSPAPKISRAQRRAEARQREKDSRNIVKCKEDYLEKQNVATEGGASPAPPPDALVARPGDRVGSKRDPPHYDVPGQQFLVISFVAPQGTRQKSKKVAIKFRGAFETEQEAKARVEEVHKFDPDFDVFFVDMYKWIELPPPFRTMMQTPMRYEDEDLNKTMQGYYRGIESSAREVKQRVQKAKAEAAERSAAYYKKEGITAPPSAAERKPRPEYNYTQPDLGNQEVVAKASAYVPFRKPEAEETREREEQEQKKREFEEARQRELESCIPFDLNTGTIVEGNDNRSAPDATTAGSGVVGRLSNDTGDDDLFL